MKSKYDILMYVAAILGGVLGPIYALREMVLGWLLL